MKSKYLAIILAVVMVSVSASIFAYADNGYESGIVPISSPDTSESTTEPITEPTTTTTTAKPTVSIKKCSISNIVNKTYTGKAIGQAPVIKYGNVTLKYGRDYVLSYKNNVNVGTATVTITGVRKNGYIESVSRNFCVNPKLAALTGVKAVKSRKMKVNWKVQSVQTNGYQIQYSLSPKFNTKDTKIITVAGAKKKTCTVKGLKKKKVYYVRIRTYRLIGRTRYCSSWSSVKKIKAK
jgi:hypothetical protein